MLFNRSVEKVILAVATISSAIRFFINKKYVSAPSAQCSLLTTKLFRLLWSQGISMSSVVVLRARFEKVQEIDVGGSIYFIMVGFASPVSETYKSYCWVGYPYSASKFVISSVVVVCWAVLGVGEV